MFDFDDLTASSPPEVYVVTGAGAEEVNGLYIDTKVEAHGAQIFRHSVLSDQLLSRESHGDRHGWVIGATRRVLYGARTEELVAPLEGWRCFKGKSPAPITEGFSSMADAALRLTDAWVADAESLRDRGKYRAAAEVFKKALTVPCISDNRKADLLAGRAKCWRMLAEVKKKPKSKALTNKESSDILDTKDDPSAGGLDPDGLDKDEQEEAQEDDTLVSLAAELAIEDAQKALDLNAKNFMAGWEGAVAAKHIGWWEKGRKLAKKAMDAVPRGEADRERREQASTLFLLLAETEQEEKRRLLTTMMKQKEPPPLDPEELKFVNTVLDDLIAVLKKDDFKRPHHQWWKMVKPGISEKSSDQIFGEIRELVWEKWMPIFRKHGYNRAWDVLGRKPLMDRIAAINSTNRAADVYDKVQEIEDRVCINWDEIPESKKLMRYDETWGYGRKPDGMWGSPHAGVDPSTMM